MIQFTNVFMTYPSGNKALQNINLNIDKGEMAYISGRSGAGKSTLLKLINLMTEIFLIMLHYPWLFPVAATKK